MTGRVLDPTFKSGDKVGKPDMDDKAMQFLYIDGEHYTFMDNTTYEQVMVDAKVVAEEAKWLKENTDVEVMFWHGKPIGVSQPNFVELKITLCEPGVKGDTAQGATKPATLETGAIVNVPLFVNEGEVIKIDSRTGTYVKWAKWLQV